MAAGAQGESNFKNFGGSRRQFVHRSVGERYNNESLEAMKHGGGSLKGRGCVSANGVGDLLKINGVLNAEKYQQIVIHHAAPSGRCLVGPNRTATDRGGPAVMVWPPQSPGQQHGVSLSLHKEDEAQLLDSTVLPQV